MKKFFLTILFTMFVSPTWATTYYLAPAPSGGSDTNSGLSANAPWLTPNHPVNCGDVILAAASKNYAALNFNYLWGAVTCSAANNVAWLKCATFDGCVISSLTSGQNGMAVGSSYWGRAGF